MSNARKPHKHAELIKQWADGARIQHRSWGDKWVDSAIIYWDEGCEYRLKPEPVGPIKVRYRLALMEDFQTGGNYIGVSESDEASEERESMKAFVRWLGGWQEVEVLQ